jgi:hypothetical protein
VAKPAKESDVRAVVKPPVVLHESKREETKERVFTMGWEREGIEIRAARKCTSLQIDEHEL